MTRANTRWFLGVLVGVVATTGATRAAEQKAVPTVSRDINHDLSPPLALMRGATVPTDGRPKAVNPIRRGHFARQARPSVSAGDPLLEQSAPIPQAPMPAPLITFEGTSDDQNQAILGFRIVPPDTNGDVGPNDYVQWNNLIFAVYDKATGVPRAGFPKAGNTLFAGFGGPCQTTNDGDPLVLYDQLANRWVLSQFAIDSGTQCVAVSQTSDPTGAYFRYAFAVTPGELNDYPKMGVWPDAYYSTYRRFNLAGTSYLGMLAAAMERDKMLLGQAAQLVTFPIPAPAGVDCFNPGECYDGVLPAHVEGTQAPPRGTPEVFVSSYDDEFFNTGPPTDGTKDFYKIWKMSVNWVVPPSSTFTGPVNVDAPEMDANLCGFIECVPQPTPGELLDHLSWFTMYRLAYRNYGDHQSIYVNASVDLGADRAGIRWAEIRDPAGTPTLFQTGTHGPADTLHRWMGSIAADAQGNVALGYSRSGSAAGQFPSIAYAGRLAGDPLGTLPQTETVMHAGTGVQTGSFNRWGDYSSMSVDDRDGCTFWYTNEYYQTTGNFDFNTRIGAFKFPNCLAVISVAPTSGPAAGGTPLTITGSGFTPSTTANIGAFACGGVSVPNSTQISCTSPALSTPGILYNVAATVPAAGTGTLWQGFFADFLDVPGAHPFHSFVEKMVRNVITAGCGGGNYCPDASNTRAQMAVFLLRAKYGVPFVPPPATGVFGDVPVSSPFAPWIERLAAEGVTGGCSTNPPLYCPDLAVTRAQMAVFLLRSKFGSAYIAPDPVGIFGDVPVSDPFARWVEDLFNRGVTGGCSVSPLLYCPTTPVTRGQMAVFLTANFNLP